MQIWLWIGLIAGFSWSIKEKWQGCMIVMSSIQWRTLAVVFGLYGLFLFQYNVKYWQTNAAYRLPYIINYNQHRPNCAFMHDIDIAYKNFPYDFTLERVRNQTHFFCDHNRAQTFNIMMKAIQDEPYFLKSLINIMPLAYQQGRKDVVKTVAQRLMRVFPWRPDGYHGYGILAWDKGNYSEAKTWFTKALSHDKHYQPSIGMLKKILTSNNK